MSAIERFRRWIHQLATERSRNTADVRSLEFEISRLRAENRALLNSILGIAGIPPLPLAPTSFLTSPAPAGHSESTPPSRDADATLSTPTSSDPPSVVPSEAPPRQSRTRNDSSHPSSPAAPRLIHAPPHRRRSWHQINRILEIESARKVS